MQENDKIIMVPGPDRKYTWQGETSALYEKSNMLMFFPPAKKEN